MQFKNRYILSDSKSGLMIVDQHRAHVRVLYEQYLPLIDSATVASQRLMLPDTIEFDAASSAILDNSREMLARLGYDLSYLGDLTWAINGVPQHIGAGDHRETLKEIVADLAETGADAEANRRERVALAMAKAAAIKIGQVLSREEMERLISDLFKLGSPKYTPDGKTIIYIIPIEQIASFF